MGKKINPEHYFVFCNGSVVRNLKELALALDDIQEHEFRHHVNEHKNDFANWVGDVFGRNELADELRQSQDKKDHQLSIFRHMIK